MKFLMLIKHAEGAPGLEHPQALYEAMGKFVEESVASGALKDTAGLKRAEHGYRIKSKGGKLTRTDGPFTESKEVIGGLRNRRDRDPGGSRRTRAPVHGVAPHSRARVRM